MTKSREDELKEMLELNGYDNLANAELKGITEGRRLQKIEDNKPINNKFILDACCGGRMFWFNKTHPNVIYIDNREREKGHSNDNTYKRNHSIKPDILIDNRKMDFPNKSFKLVVFDPPHLIGEPDGCRMTKQFGSLNAETWQSDIKRGFDECWRVLDDYGVLIFKWNDSSKKRKEVLDIIGKQPLFGHPNGSKIPTHWFCFMKIPEVSNG